MIRFSDVRRMTRLAIGPARDAGRELVIRWTAIESGLCLGDEREMTLFYFFQQEPVCRRRLAADGRCGRDTRLNWTRSNRGRWQAGRVARRDEIEPAVQPAVLTRLETIGDRGIIAYGVGRTRHPCRKVHK